MKRLLFFAALIVAIGSFGGHITAVHAQAISTQALTSEQTAALQQQLDVAKATLAQLEMKAGMVPPADAGTPSVIPTSIAGTGSQTSATVATNSGLSADQISAFKGTLSTLAATLTQLNTSLTANAALAPSQEAAVATTLSGMQNTLVAMANTIATANNLPASAPVAAAQPAGSPVAVNNPSTATTPGAAAGSASAAQTPSATTPAVTAQVLPSTNNNVPQTAEASSFLGFTKAHWPTILIILLVIAILAILFWPEKQEPVKTVSTGTSGSGKPKSAPTMNATVSQSQNTASFSAKPMTNNSHAATPAPATPVASAVAAPSQK